MYTCYRSYEAHNVSRAFGSAWTLLLSSPREPITSTAISNLDQKFKGGLGLSPQSLGYTMAFAGLAGLLLQFLFYPTIHKKFGTLKCYRLFSLLFPVVYAASPFLVIMAGSSTLTWFLILLLLFIHSTGRIFCVPASITLLNNCSPHPSVLGIVHGIGQAIASAFRTLGPVCAGYRKFSYLPLRSIINPFALPFFLSVLFRV